MIVEYQNSKGDVRQILVATMAEAPEWATFNPDGDAQRADANDPLAYRRVISATQRPITSRANDAVAHRTETLPVSYALPRTREKGEVVNRWGHQVRKLKNGAYADMNGRRIVANREDAARHSAETGYTRQTD